MHFTILQLAFHIALGLALPSAMSETDIPTFMDESPAPNDMTGSFKPRYSHDLRTRGEDDQDTASLAMNMRAPKAAGSEGESGGCTKYHFVFARGTTERQGFGMVGTPLAAALTSGLGSVSKYSVVYAAGAMQQSQPGSKDADKHITEYAAKCPKAKFIISGYSQGAALVHDMKGGSWTKNVCSILLFGDPRKPGGMGQAMGNGAKLPIDDKTKVHNACNANDRVCGPKNPLGTGDGHLGYVPKVVPAAAKFAIDKCK